MPTIDTPFKITRVPGQGRAQDEYRLPGTHPAIAEPHADATGPGAQAPTPPMPRARGGRRAADKPARTGLDSTWPRQPEAAPDAKPAAPVRITGRIFALRDGSGYAALGSDGNYYRVDGSGSRGLAYARTGGFVDASMVNVTGGPVSVVQARATAPTDAGLPHAATGQAPNAAAGQAGPQSAPIPGAAGSSDAGLPDAEHAATQSHATRQLIAEHPRTAMRSQANVPPHNAISLLR